MLAAEHSRRRARARGEHLGAPDEAGQRICERVAPDLRSRGILFAGLDVIGSFLTEINVTSPTGIRELDSAFDLNIAGTLFDAIDSRLAAKRRSVA